MTTIAFRHLESRMHENVPVRFGRGRLVICSRSAGSDLAAYLISQCPICKQAGLEIAVEIQGFCDTPKDSGLGIG